VGLNGAGKTTLIKLLTRLYDPTEGEILLDGYNIKEYAVEDLYSMFGIIFQDFGKYAVNVKENIAFGKLDRDAGEEEIRLAAEQSSAAPFIEQLPNGYNTPLMRYFEENGIELSIGQWQKLSIARAFYSDSDVIILDEPTASLDAIAEQEIYNQFDQLRKDKTTVFVSHRLSSATVANKIVVLENGAVIEIGNHAELMAKKGVYHTLFSTQAKRYIASEEEINALPDAPTPQGNLPPMGDRPLPPPDKNPPFEGMPPRRP
jgi:ABC-type multidrug transport system fused ATPase/permease subunit